MTPAMAPEMPGLEPEARENIERNLRQWDQKHPWSQDGDEWSGQAAVCKVPYEVWKESLVANLLLPNLTGETTALEIAPGHGRWTEYIARHARHVIVVELSPSCLAFCRDRFADLSNIDYYLTTGSTLPRFAAGRVDFVWSYDSFVHMDKGVISSYLAEIRRVLKPGGTATIHHSDVADPGSHQQNGAPGWRSAMSGALMRELAETAGLAVLSQFTYWDEEAKIGVPRFGDQITTVRRG